MSEEIQVDLTISELAMEKMRDERNILLQNTDKYALSDYPHSSDSVKQAWITYRQELRNLSVVSGNLDGVDIGLTTKGRAVFTNLTSGNEGAGYDVRFFGSGTNKSFSNSLYFESAFL